jgi:acid phosphatase family membrane protein YuiD
LNKTDKTAVRVVKKTSGLPNNQVQAVIIFKDSSEDIRVSDKAWDDSVRKKKEARLKKLAEKVMEKKKADGEKTMKLNMRIIKMSFITGTTLGVLIGWVYYVLDYFGKL